MGQAKVMTHGAMSAMAELSDANREVVAGELLTTARKARLNAAVDAAYAEVISMHHRVRVISLLTRDVQDIRRFEETATRAGIRNGLALLDPPPDAA